ncbi:transcriptional repressor LexA [Ectothiorhodospira lacustris]|uniref:transcriptional repressor LexA n=1 Tax=Ectothiorhodospira lacustris TaxID=2899127 RepID=UPI001EE83392|nr:transcriptional repressor LexA [Ectothiorhodospira lacustris]MCG5500789.1 transcriptional repressor LexA [Ectothiorhodospira lacustris]MCG5509354.1 transcriptional repressor LexA [Ectothiorhodospira lacustris]MCG5521408.1 transcriptional repressor LexA [Ectothiorhodospira lacustris]
MEKLTPRQTEILNFIRDCLQSNGMPPTREEIMRAFGFRSPNAAECHLRTLARKGAIEILAGTSRGIRLREGPGLPLVGRVAAGEPILAEAHIEDHYQLDPRLFRPRPDYLLRVQGDSMRLAGILDGDLLAVHRTSEVRNGQIVVARLEDEVTVKRFEREGHRVRLKPENPDYRPIDVDLRSQFLDIEGIGVGVIRSGSW